MACCRRVRCAARARGRRARKPHSLWAGDEDENDRALTPPRAVRPSIPLESRALSAGQRAFGSARTPRGRGSQLGRRRGSRAGKRSDNARAAEAHHVPPRSQSTGRTLMKGLQKPKKLQKKQAQKTLKERRSEKRAGVKKNLSDGL